MRISRKELIQLVLQERQRAVDIAYGMRKEFEKSYQSKLKAGNQLAFIDQKLADNCRILGNTISGGNALSAVLGETMKDRIEIVVDEFLNKK